jgi:hypothetical protein
MFLKIIRGLIWGFGALVGFVLALIAMLIAFSMIFLRSQNGAAVGWDPVSLFHHQPVYWLLLLIPVAVFALGFRFGLRHQRLAGAPR